MGTYAKAITFYGYIWTEDEADDAPEIGFDLGDATRAVMTERQIPDPWADKPDNVEYRDWYDGHAAEIDEWRATRQAVEDEFPIDVAYHGHYDFMQPYAYIRSSRLVAEWGEPKPLNTQETDPAWREQLEAFMAEQGIEPPVGENQPGWWSAAYYG